MATSGSVTSNVNNTMYLTVDWWRKSYDADTQKAIYTVSAYFRNDTNICYRVYGGTDSNYVSVAGRTLFTYSNGGAGTRSDPRHAYGPITAYDADRTAWYANWTEGSMYVYAVAHLFSNVDVEVNINDNGASNFTINAVLSSSVGTFVIGTTIVPDVIDVFSKTPYKDGSWTNNGRIWHKESGVWKKRKLFKRENSSWVKK